MSEISRVENNAAFNGNIEVGSVAVYERQLSSNEVLERFQSSAPTPLVERMNNDVLLSLRAAQQTLRNTLAALETLEAVVDEKWFGRLAVNADELLTTCAGQFSDAMTAAGITLPRD